MYADITNLWNASTILTVNRRYPSLGIAGFDDPMEFEAPTAIIAPRQWTIGARWSF